LKQHDGPIHIPTVQVTGLKKKMEKEKEKTYAASHVGSIICWYYKREARGVSRGIRLFLRSCLCDCPRSGLLVFGLTDSDSPRFSCKFSCPLLLFSIILITKPMHVYIDKN